MIALSLALLTIAAAVHAPPIHLRLGYTIKFDTVTFGTGPYTERNQYTLLRNGKLIFSDTDDFVREDGYPLLFHFVDHDELLVRVDRRPSMDEVHQLFIRDDSIVRIDTLPLFNRAAADLAGDGKPRYNGIRDLIEYWDSAGTRVMYYHPMLYYVLTPKGLLLDSALTINKNKSIYGRFYGCEIGDPVLPAAKIDRALNKEWNRIAHARKVKLHGF